MKALAPDQIRKKISVWLDWMVGYGEGLNWERLKTLCEFHGHDLKIAEEIFNERYTARQHETEKPFENRDSGGITENKTGLS